MRLDIRLPIGLLFTLLGLVLAFYGIMSDPALYQRSLGININLWWGIVLVAFGGMMTFLSPRTRSRPTSDAGESPDSGRATRSSEDRT